MLGNQLEQTVLLETVADQLLPLALPQRLQIHLQTTNHLTDELLVNLPRNQLPLQRLQNLHLQIRQIQPLVLRKPRLRLTTALNQTHRLPVFFKMNALLNALYRLSRSLTTRELLHPLLLLECGINIDGNCLDLSSELLDCSQQVRTVHQVLVFISQSHS